MTCSGSPVLCDVTFTYRVANVGTADAGAFDVLEEADQVPSNTTTIVGGLLMGASKEVTTTLGLGGNCYDPDCTVKVTADSGGAVAESDETNNTDTRTDLG